MTARLLRAVTRPFKRLLRAARLRHIDYLVSYSNCEIERLNSLAIDLVELRCIEHRYQVRLSMQRQQIERAA